LVRVLEESVAAEEEREEELGGGRLGTPSHPMVVPDGFKYTCTYLPGCLFGTKVMFTCGGADCRISLGTLNRNATAFKSLAGVADGCRCCCSLNSPPAGSGLKSRDGRTLESWSAVAAWNPSTISSRASCRCPPPPLPEDAMMSPVGAPASGLIA